MSRSVFLIAVTFFRDSSTDSAVSADLRAEAAAVAEQGVDARAITKPAQGRAAQGQAEAAVAAFLRVYA